MNKMDGNDTPQLRLDGSVRRKRRPHRATVLPACSVIPGIARVMRNVERRAASRRLCI